MMISLITPYYHEEPFLQYIEAVKKFMPEPYEWIVVDDRGNGYNSVFTKYIKNPVRLGYSKSINIGIRESTARKVLLLNNDAMLSDGCVQELDRILSSDSRIGMVGARAFSDGKYVGPVEYDLHSRLYGRLKEHDDRTEVHLLNSECVLIRREMIDDIGLMDEDHYWHDGSDLEYCMRAVRFGWRLMFAKNTTLYHEHGRYKKDKEVPENDVVMPLLDLLIKPEMLIKTIEIPVQKRAELFPSVSYIRRLAK